MTLNTIKDVAMALERSYEGFCLLKLAWLWWSFTTWIDHCVSYILSVWGNSICVKHSTTLFGINVYSRFTLYAALWILDAYTINYTLSSGWSRFHPREMWWQICSSIIFRHPHIFITKLVSSVPNTRFKSLSKFTINLECARACTCCWNKESF